MRQIRVSDLDKRIAQALATLVSGGDARIAYLVVDEEGELIASSDPRWIRNPPTWIARTGTEGLFLDANTAGSTVPKLVISTPILDLDRRNVRLGTLYGVLDWDRLTNVMDLVRNELSAQGIAAEIAVADSEGTIMKRSSPDEGSGFSQTTLAAVAALAGSAPDYYVDEGDDLIAGRAALTAEGANWSLLVVEPLSHALAPAVRLRNRLALTTAAMLIIALGIAALGARRVIRPLTELTEAIDNIAREGSSAALVPVRSEDEIGTLATAFNKMATDLDESQRHLIEAEKFAFVGELAAGVAHEVRTSLGVLQSSAQIIGRSLTSESSALVREMIEMISAEVERLSHVVDDLLNLDHKRPFEFRATPLSLPIRSAVDFVRRQAEEKGIEIIEQFESGEALIVRCDRQAIQQVCINLLSNSIASLERGETIEVTVSDDPLPGHRGSGHQGSVATFSVRDNGRGVPEDLADHIFDPFVTGRASGIGLGLTSVKRVMVDHLGSVRLVPSPNGGAWFVVELPLWESVE